MYVRELVVSYRRHHTGVASPPILATPAQTAALLTITMSEQPVEVFVVVFLATKHQLLGVHHLSRGGISSTVANPREVFQAALLANAASIIVSHNHPSGDPDPNAEDRSVTNRLTAAGDLIGIPVLDHIIIGHDGRYFSFKEKGELTCR